MPRAYPFLPSMHLKRKRDFERVYRDGSRARGSMMTVCVAANGLAERRLGLSIGRRVWRHAVRRNRVRRLFRESFRLSYPELPAGVDLIIIGSQPRVEPQLEASCAELVYLAKKAYRRHLERQAELARIAAQGADSALPPPAPEEASSSEPPSAEPRSSEPGATSRGGAPS